MAKKTTAKQPGVARKTPTGRPFKKGQSGNPKGRPPIGKSLAEIVRRVGEEPNQDGIARIEAVVRRIYKAASKGGAQAAALLFDRGWGKATQPLEMNVHNELTADEIRKIVFGRIDGESD